VVLPLEAADPGSSLSPPRGAGAALADRGLTPSGIVSQDEEAIRVRAAIEALEDATDRAILQLRFVDGISLRQIAERLSLSIDRVRDRFGFGLRHLQRHLESLR
jgi:RNA polymerase sigma factor (sigma-70 family)